MTFQRAGFVIAIAAMLVVGLPVAYAQQGEKAEKKEHAFKGKVEKIDAKAKTLTVNGENVEGWMPAMTMNYGVDKEDVMKALKVGDEITAKVYDGDFKTLHDVQVTPPKAKK